MATWYQWDLQATAFTEKRLVVMISNRSLVIAIALLGFLGCTKSVPPAVESRPTIVAYPVTYVMDSDLCVPDFHQVVVKHVESSGNFVGPYLTEIHFAPSCGSGKTEDQLAELMQSAKCPEYEGFATRTKIGEGLGYTLTDQGKCILEKRF